MKQSILIFAMLMSMLSTLYSQQDEQAGNSPGAISDELPSYDPADYVQPPAGKVRQLERKGIADVKDDINGLITGVAQGTAWLTKVNLLQQSLNQFANSELRSDFLNVVPHLYSSHLEVALLSPDEGSTESKYLSSLSELAQYVHTEIYNLIKEKGAILSNQEWDLVAEVTLFRSLWEMGAWEDEPNYVIAPGGFIVDATKATTLLKTKTLDEIKTFLGGTIDNSFFERYEAAGDGMDVLKTKYAANKVAIQAKFAEVVAYAAQLEAQQ